jgi:hypothetical protein
MSRCLSKRTWIGMGGCLAFGLAIALTGCEKQQGPAGEKKALPPTAAKESAKSEAKPSPSAAKPAEAPKTPAQAPAKPAPPAAAAAKAAEPAPVPPPPGVKVLFDGKDASGWVRTDGKPCPWKVENGALCCVPSSGSIMTQEKFGDFQLHIEFMTPLMPDAKGQARGNSGVYLQGRYEIQILDSLGLPPKDNECGSLYSIVAPRVNACKPPETWQTYDITFRAPKFDVQGKMTQKGELTVIQNETNIIDKFALDKNTPGELDKDLSKPGPLMLQDHGNLVKFRNIWMKPL